MHVVQWSKASRHISQAAIDDFYHRPLSAPTVFRFTTSRLDMPAHGGALSLKTVRAGEETYSFGRRSVRLRPGQFLIVNEGETYSSRIDRRTSSMALFAPAGEAASASRAALADEETLLDDPFADTRPPEMAQIAFFAGPSLLAALDGFERAIVEDDCDYSLQRMRDMLAAAFTDLGRVAPRRALERVKKRSTRDEIIERVLRAKTLIDDTDGQLCDLDALAEAACLSKYHFLRAFAEVCGRPPASYARLKRLERARRSIARDGNTAAAARRAGYTDQRAFERALRRIFGAAAPSC